MRVNGAIEGGASGFALADEVVVLKKFDNSKTYVVAHADGIRACSFRFKILRDDGVWVTEDMVEEFEIYLDDRKTARVVPIAYLWNIDVDPEEEGQPEVIKMRDTLYNLRPIVADPPLDPPQYERGNKRYDPVTKIWTFDGFQRTWPWMYGDTEADDFNKPTSAPPSNLKFNPSTGEYEAKTTTGYYVHIRLKTDSIFQGVYYRVPAPSDPVGQLARGYKYDMALYDWDAADASLLQPGLYLFRVPYYKVTRWEESTHDEPGYVVFGDGEEVDYTKDYFTKVNWLYGTSIFSIKTSWASSFTIKSSVPYTVSETVYPHIASFIEIEQIGYPVGCSVVGAYVAHSGPYGGPDVRIDGHGNLPRTFNPVDIPASPAEVTVIPEGSMNEQTHSMSIGWSGGSHRVVYGGDFVEHMLITDSPLAGPEF